ncbi:MAG TPA: hypothetical protein PLD84_15150, partial [Chitinophagales bacterium]|nr:hypothetical protein [Chitinophagales bacterium]
MKSIPIIILSLAAFCISHAQVVNTFDNPNISQWELEGDGALLHDAVNGLPGGCLHFDDPATGIISVMIIPPDYLGAWNDDDQEISFDMKVVTSDNDEIENFPWVIEISGPGGTAQALPGYIAPHNVWVHISLPVNAANWTVLSGSWEEILASVNQVRIRVEYIGGVEDTYIDNVALSFTPGINEITGDVCSDFETYGFDGWNCKNVASVSYSETGGNPGGAMQVGDASNKISLAYAPWKFRGDWSVLGENALFNFDVRVNSGSGLYMQKEYLVKISGSGGTAIIPPDYVQIAGAVNQWKTFSIPVDPAAWTVTSGTWEGLLSNVQELILELEFIQGSETVLIDNVCLISDNLLCTADGGTVSPASATACAKDSYVMTATGATDDPSVSFQWMVAETQGGPYTNVSGGSGANTTAYTTGKLKKGIFYYVLEASCAGGETDFSNEFVLDVKGQPDAAITPEGPTSFCKGDEVVLTASGGSNRTYQWLKKDEAIAGATAISYTADTKGKYKVQVTNTVTGCINASPAVKVEVYEDPIAIITPQGSTTFCEGGSVVLQANTGAGLTYQWKKGNSFISGATQPDYTATEKGNYKVEVTDANGCTKLSEI